MQNQSLNEAASKILDIASVVDAADAEGGMLIKIDPKDYYELLHAAETLARYIDEEFGVTKT